MFYLLTGLWSYTYIYIYLIYMETLPIQKAWHYLFYSAVKKNLQCYCVHMYSKYTSYAFLLP